MSRLQFHQTCRNTEVKHGTPFFISRIFIKHPGSRRTIFQIKTFTGIVRNHFIFSRPFLNKDVVIESVITVQECHKSHHFGTMRHMIRSISPSGSAAHACQSTAAEIVYHSNTLRSKTKAYIREQNIVVDQGRTMAYFHENILRHHASLQILCKFGHLIVVHQVLGKTGSLCFPVTPDSHCTMMDMIAAHGNVNRCMHLDTCNLCSALFHHVIDMMNVVVFNNTERGKPHLFPSEWGSSHIWW